MQMAFRAPPLLAALAPALLGLGHVHAQPAQNVDEGAINLQIAIPDGLFNAACVVSFSLTNQRAAPGLSPTPSCTVPSDVPDPGVGAIRVEISVLEKLGCPAPSLCPAPARHTQHTASLRRTSAAGSASA